MSGEAGRSGGAARSWRGVWRWAHALSLDVTLGAVGLSGAVARAWGAPQTSAVAWALGAATLSIYSVDHLLDLRRAQARCERVGVEPTAGVSARRQAHLRARPLLRALALTCALAGVALLPLLPPPLLALGLTLGALCALYLLWAQRGGAGAPLKPWLVTVGYAAGVSLAGVSGRVWGAELTLAPSLSELSPTSGLSLIFGLPPISGLPPIWTGLTATALATLCAALNVLLLSRHEAGGARAVALGDRVAGVALVGALGALLSPARSLLSPLALPPLALAALWWTPRWSSQRDRYRLLGDAALCLSWVFMAL